MLRNKSRRCPDMFRPKFKFSYEEIRIIVIALVELKNQLIAEGRHTDAVDDLLVKFVV
jgi:hypothetical protein